MAGKPPIRIPLVSPLETRPASAYSGVVTTDSFLINAYVETQPDGRKFVIKRPGSAQAATYNGGAATNGQGTYYYKGCLFAMGSNTLYRLSGTGNGSTTGATWAASTAAAWAGRSNFGCCVFNGQIIVAGGQNAGGLAYLNDVWASPDGVNWTQLVSAAPWTKRIYGNLVVLGNLLYLVGGSGVTQDFNDVWSTPDGVNWTQVVNSAPWVARNGHVVVAYNQGIWVLGGFNTAAATYLNDVWFSPDGATWTQMVTTATWGVRAFHGGLVQNGKLIVAGGYNGARLSDIWTSTDGIVWTNLSTLPAVRSHMAVFAYNSLAWFVGGYDNAAAKTTTVWSWNVTAAAPTVATANYGGGAIQGALGVVIRTPTSVNVFNAVTLWLIGGNDAGFRNSIYRATLDTVLASSFVIGTSGVNNIQFQFAEQNAGDYLVFKNTSDAWVLYGGVVSKITSTNYPTATVAGLVNLDDTVYVMDINGIIYGSNLSDPFTWSSLNFITADYASDSGVALVKYQNYVLALKSTSMQMFYDAGRFPGSPLLPAIQYNARIGCASSDTVQAFNNTVIWVARTEELGPYVVAMEGSTPNKISDAQVDKLLQAWIPVPGSDYSTTWRTGGHYFYLLSMFYLAVTLVYDFTEKEWHIARSGTNALYSVCNYMTDGQLDYMQDKSLGILYRLDPTLYADAGTTITCSGQTVMVDGGNNGRKFTGGLTAIGDRRASSAPNNLLIQWSDDDAQTFNTGQTVDLTLARPRISRTGSFRRRRYLWTHASNNPMRLEALEQEIA